jgi:hypothetical protein
MFISVVALSFLRSPSIYVFLVYWIEKFYTLHEMFLTC